MHKIAITSGKGGVGKTSLSANLGIALTQAGARTTLFDADLQLANVDVTLGIQPAYTLQHVVSGERTLSEAICNGPGGLRVIAGGSAISILMAAGPKRMGMFLDQLDGLASNTDFLLFDTSAGLDNRVVTFWKAADEILVITTPDPTSVTDAYATIKVAVRRAPETPISVIVNMANDDIEAAAVFRTLADIAARFLDTKISLLGTIPMDTMAAACIRKRSPFMITAPNCPAAHRLKKVAASLQSRFESGLLAA